MSVRGIHAGTVAGPRTTAPPPPQRGTRLHEFQRLVSRKEPWREHSACRGKDPKHWHPETGSSTAYDFARSICETCPVRDRCLDEAIRMDERAGMWGGLTPAERGRQTVARGAARTPWSQEIRRLISDGEPWPMESLADRLASLIPLETKMSYLRSFNNSDHVEWSETNSRRGAYAVVHAVCRQLRVSGRATVTRTADGFVVQQVGAWT